MKLAHIGLNCLDPAAIEAWYSAKLGFRRERAIPMDGWDLVFISRGDLVLELFKVDDAHPAGRPAHDGPTFQGVRHIALQVDDLDRTLAELGEIEVTRGPVSLDALVPGWRAVWIADPEGNIIELSQGYRPE